MNIDRALQLQDAWDDLLDRANDAMYMGNAEELRNSWNDLDMLRHLIKQEAQCTPSQLKQRYVMTSTKEQTDDCTNTVRSRQGYF